MNVFFLPVGNNDLYANPPSPKAASAEILQVDGLGEEQQEG